MICKYDEARYELMDMAEEASRGLELVEGVPMKDAYQVLVNYLMPMIGFWMVDQDVDAIPKDMLVEIWEDLMADVEPDWYWDIYDSAERREVLPVLKEMEAELLIEMLTGKMKVLSQTGENVYRFSKPLYKTYFAAREICGKLECMAEIAEDAKEMEDEGLKAEAAEFVVEELAFFEEKIWPKEVLRMCAEHFRIPDTIPHQCLEGWFQDQGMSMRKDMNLFRRGPENPVMDMLQNRRALAGEGKEFYFEKNLLEMLRQGRQAKHYVDFTGIDFHGIDLTGVDLCQVVFAHKRRGEVWAANLKDTGVEAYFANK